MVREHITIREAQELLDQFLQIPVVLTAPNGLHAEALAIAHRHALPAVYDAHYLAVAELYQCPLWTADRRLLRALGGKGDGIHWIGDYAGNPVP